MSVNHYATKFQSLSRFAHDLVNSEEKKCKRFEQGLHPSIQRLIVGDRIRIYSELVECTGLIESQCDPVKEVKIWEPRRQFFGSSSLSGSFGKKRFRDQSRPQHNQRQQRQGSRPGLSKWSENMCHICRRPGHHRSECQAATCYQWGQQGYKA